MNLFWVVLVLLYGCTIEQTVTPVERKPLAWGENHKDWNGALYDELNKVHFKSNIKTPCKAGVSLIDCTAQLISIMAKYESNWDPAASYKESFVDRAGRPVVSRGLLQLSQESANQSAYACGIAEAKDLHDAKKNLRCGVRIISHWANRDGVLMGESKKGCARYWSVCRKSSKSNAAIVKYMTELEIVK